MAIGIHLPPRQIAQTRLQLRTVETAFGCHPQILRGSILRVVSITRVVWRRLFNAVSDALRHQERTRKRHRAQFIAFEHQYDCLVDLLCASARDGVNMDRDREYRYRREWMMVHYPPIAKRLGSYLSETQQSALDPFQALFCPSSLEATINIPSTIEDITRSRSALEGYGATFKSGAD